MKDASTPPASAERLRDRPFLVLITSHWLSLLGMGLAVTALISWLFVLPLHLRGHVDNPYIGIVVFLIIPVVLVAGLAMIPVGVFLARRRARRRLTEHVVDRKVAVRRLVGFLGGVTLVNVIVGTQATYRAVEHMETVQFCGQTCHVMTPEFRSHAVSPHARVPCVDCHVGEGARGWFESKIAGTRQLVEVIANSYPRPIPSALESGRLVPARETCETCHWPEKFVSARLRVIPRFAEDEANTATQTVLMMMVGGSLIVGNPRLALRPRNRGPLCGLRQEAPKDPVGRIPRHQERRDALLPRRRRGGGRGDPSPGLRDAVRGLPQSPHAHVRVCRTAPSTRRWRSASCPPRSRTSRRRAWSC